MKRPRPRQHTISGQEKIYIIDQSDCFWCMVTRLEGKQTGLDESDIQNKVGTYIFWDWENKPIRIGIAAMVRNRIISYDTNPNNWNIYEKMYPHIAFVSVIYTSTRMEANILEKDLLYTHQPKYNIHHKNYFDKTK